MGCRNFYIKQNYLEQQQKKIRQRTVHKHCSYAQEFYGIRKNGFPRACVSTHLLCKSRCHAVEQGMWSRARWNQPPGLFLPGVGSWASQFFLNTSFLVSKWGDLTTLSHMVLAWLNEIMREKFPAQFLSHERPPPGGQTPPATLLGFLSHEGKISFPAPVQEEWKAQSVENMHTVTALC